MEVFADIWCPFAHVGLRAFVTRREQLSRDDLAIRIHAWPLELINGMPLDPETTNKHVLDLKRQVAPDLFVGFDPTHFPTTTLPALALAASAYHKNMKTGEAVSFALRDALFEHGHDLARREVLADIAEANGVTPPESSDRDVMDDWRAGEARGVKGSPHFFCGDLEIFCPSLNIAHGVGGHLAVSRDLEAMNGFLAECLKR